MVETTMSLWESLGFNAQTMILGIALFVSGGMFFLVLMKLLGKKN